MTIKTLLKILIVIACTPLILLVAAFTGDVSGAVLYVKDLVKEDHLLSRKDMEKMTN